MANSIVDRIISGLEDLAKNHTREEIAERCNTSQETIVRLLNRQRGANPERFTLNMALKIWEGLGNPPETLLNPNARQPVITIAGNLSQIPSWVRPDNYLSVPLVDGRIAAGTGRIVSEEINDLVWIYNAEIGARKNLVAVKLAEDARSMEPTLHPGDIVVIDRDDKTLIPKGIYAVRMEPEGCAITRLQLAKNHILLISDNPDFPPEVSESDSLDELIVGRLIWSWTNWLG